MALRTHIEAGFEDILKTSAVFVDFTAAYVTVWRHGLYKLHESVPWKQTLQLRRSTLRTSKELLISQFDKIEKQTVYPLLMEYPNTAYCGNFDDVLWQQKLQCDYFECMFVTVLFVLYTLCILNIVHTKNKYK